jgi:hypothetical protein
MLTFYVLNVGQGSSIVVEHKTDTAQSFGVIDSNTPAGGTPKALAKLKQLGANRLSFVALTHPHRDHFSGLYSIISAFPNAIDSFYSCPFGDLLHNRDRLKKLTTGLNTIMSRSDGTVERLAALEMAQILFWANQGAAANRLDWYECKGEEFSIAPTGFSDIAINTILPPARVVSEYVSRISRGDMSVFGKFDDNEISLAFKFLYKGKCIVLGGDGTEANWRIRRRYEHRGEKKLAAEAVNLPHHGSKYDCTGDVLNQLFSGDGRRFAVTSADGISHPDLEVIEWLEKNSIEPFCTNLIQACGANVQRLIALPTLEPELARWIREVAVANEVQTCQGDVMIRIDQTGDLTVEPEYNHPCGYRGDYDRFFFGLK